MPSETQMIKTSANFAGLVNTVHTILIKKSAAII